VVEQQLGTDERMGKLWKLVWVDRVVSMMCMNVKQGIDMHGKVKEMMVGLGGIVVIFHLVTRDTGHGGFEWDL
jgi:hypothetical protein